MKINEILVGGECRHCGKIHKCDIEHIYVESGAIYHLAELCADFNHILLVADENTFSVAGEKTEAVLSGKILDKVIFSGKSILIPNEKSVQRIEENLHEIDLIIGIGSGVIQDLCKYVAYFAKLPYMVVATAPSMDGYASTGAAMILKGMKETVPAGLPKAIIADIDILKDAPLEMIKAGYGDIIGKFSALCDWKLARVVNGEYFCKYIYDTTYDMILKTLNTASGLLERNEESIKTLTEALMIVGIMMSFAASSRHASGSEHHLSHFFEITGIINSEPYFAHGIDVAYSTVVTAELREKILKKEFSNKQYSLDREVYKKKMLQVYSTIAEECIALQDRVGNYKKDRISVYKNKEKEIREILSEMPSAEKIKKMLSIAKLDISEFYHMYGDEKIETAILYAKDLKDRYTVLWMNYDLFGDEK